jgi:hypothetical protein
MYSKFMQRLWLAFMPAMARAQVVFAPPAAKPVKKLNRRKELAILAPLVLMMAALAPAMAEAQSKITQKCDLANAVLPGVNDIASQFWGLGAGVIGPIAVVLVVALIVLAATKFRSIILTVLGILILAAVMLPRIQGTMDAFGNAKC